MFWLEVLGVEFRCAFDRVPQWQSHLDSIDIAYDDDDDDDNYDDSESESLFEYNCQLSIVIRIVIAMKVNIGWCQYRGQLV